MNPDNLTEAVSTAISSAQQIAVTRKQQNITVAHLFKALVQPGELARQIYSELGLDVSAVEKELDDEIDAIAVVEGSSVTYGQSLSANLYELLQDAEQVKNKLDDKYIAVDTLTIALMRLHGDKFKDYLTGQDITEQKSPKCGRKNPRWPKSS
ncbi:ClpB protein [Lentilactobacillus kosonis]|uniref:ClpB protein n=1 Tax=Lentilactobacillus kosonis TaxID=2810561 RepID=A0A401FL82_9LACO|nr:ClpB protein [Lentilactobacillus kosonis]